MWDTNRQRLIAYPNLLTFFPHSEALRLWVCMHGDPDLHRNLRDAQRAQWLKQLALAVSFSSQHSSWQCVCLVLFYCFFNVSNFFGVICDFKPIVFGYHFFLEYLATSWNCEESHFSPTTILMYRKQQAWLALIWSTCKRLRDSGLRTVFRYLPGMCQYAIQWYLLFKNNWQLCLAKTSFLQQEIVLHMHVLPQKTSWQAYFRFRVAFYLMLLRPSVPALSAWCCRPSEPAIEMFSKWSKISERN